MIKLLIQRLMKLFKHEGGESYVISAVILSAVAIAVGLGVVGWAQGRSSMFTDRYSETMSAETAKLNERLAVEFICYNAEIDEIKIYLFWGHNYFYC